MMKVVLRIMQWITIVVDRCISFSFLIAGGILFSMGPIAFYEVVGRKLGHPSSWIFQYLEYSQLFLIWFGAAYTQKVRGHVNVDIITRILPLTLRIIVRVIADFFCLVISSVLVWQSWLLVERNYAHNLMTTEVIMLPLYWLQIPMLFGAFLFFLVFLNQILSEIRWLILGGEIPED